MKLFIRTSDLANPSPTIIAYYPEDSEISPQAHGENMTVITVPSEAVVYEQLEAMPVPMLKLTRDWRERAGPMLMQAEAKRRIDEVSSSDEQMLMLYELHELSIKHGNEVGKWPSEAKTRKADIDQKFNYVREIKERVRAVKSAPMNPTSDKIWPTRINKT